MPEVGSASLAIIPSFKGFQSDLENGSSKALTAAGTTGGEKFGDAASKAGGARFKAGIAKAAKVAAAGLALATAGAIKFAGDALEEARESQKVGALTEATIKSTGKAAKVTAEQVGDLAGAISAKSGIDDEAIQKGANLILTFKNIRNEAGKGNRIFDRTTQAVTDMAAAMAGGSGGDIDLKAASIQVGKALNDPVKGVTALSKVGVTFTNQQRAQIKALVEGGDANAAMALGLIDTTTTYTNLLKENGQDAKKVADILTRDLTPAQKKAFDMYAEGGHTLEAQKRVLKELKSEFGGAAAAQATEADKLSVAWGNFKEEIGTELIPVMDKFEKFLRKKGIPAAQDFVGWVRDDMIPAAKDLAEDMKPLVGHAKDLAKFLSDLPNGAKLAALASVVGGVGLSKLRGGNLAGGGGGILGGIGRATGLAKPIPVYVTNMGAGGIGGGVPLGGPLGGPAGTAGTAGKVSKAAKVGSFAAKAYWPVALLTTTAIALKDLENWNHAGDTGLGRMGGGKIGAWARGIANAKDEASDAKARFDNMANAAEKVERQLGDTKNAGQKLVEELFKIDKTDPKVNITAPGFDLLFERTRLYRSLLDGLDGDTIRTFVKQTTKNNVIEETGGTGGKTPRVAIHVDKVEAHDYNDFMAQLNNRVRGQALDGVR